ncbi:hypothetical protein [Oricola cellulosilytica]|nr:hypothetical protein [Oricola cellulosilytica]
MPDKDRQEDEARFNETLKRMLETPPDPKGGKKQDKSKQTKTKEKN